MPIDLGGTALPQHCQAGSVALFFSLFFFSGPPFLIGRLQAENLLDFMSTEKGRAWKCYSFCLQFFGLYGDQTNKTFLNNTNNELKPMPAPLAPPRASGEPSCIII